MPVISTKELGRKYSDRWAVRDLNLEVLPGEVFGLLGPNGAGKTTTMRMLAGLIAPTTGTATVCGLDVATRGPEVRRKIGILTEATGLYESLSAARNLEFFAKLYDVDHGQIKARVQKYLSLFGLWERRGDSAVTFSRGMKQKLSMARALIHEPPVVILDEPTSVLDPESAKVVRDLLESLRVEGRTIILCTHNLYEAQGLCDRVAIVKQTLLRVGTPRELQRSLYGRTIEIRLATGSIGMNSEPQVSRQSMNLNDLAVEVAVVEGVGDVTVSGDRLLVAMLDPGEVVPAVVRRVVEFGADVLRVAEVEHSLERAYLDLVARHDSNTNATAEVVAA